MPKRVTFHSIHPTKIFPIEPKPFSPELWYSPEEIESMINVYKRGDHTDFERCNVKENPTQFAGTSAEDCGIESWFNEF